MTVAMLLAIPATGWGGAVAGPGIPQPGPSALMQEGSSGADGTTEVALPAVEESPTEVPPTEAPPTEVPPTNVPPTEVPPTEAPPTAVPTDPATETPVPTETPAPTATETITTTVTPSPTATPSPAVSWALGPELACTTDAAPVVSGGSILYTCTLDASVVATAAPGLALVLAWDITTDQSSDDWAIAVRQSGAGAWTDAGAGTPLAVIDRFTAGSTTDAQTLSRPLRFELRLTRAACVTADPPVRLRAEASLTAPSAPALSITVPETAAREATVTPVLAAIPEPSIAFSGPLAFGQVSLPSKNEQVAVLAGTTTVKIEGLDRSCGVWTIAIESGPLASSGGGALDAANLLLVSVNGQLAPASPCGLDEPCLVAMIVAGPTSLPSVQLVLGFQVVVPPDAPMGLLTAPVTATISRETSP